MDLPRIRWDRIVVCERVSPVYDVIRMKEKQFFEGKDHEDWWMRNEEGVVSMRVKDQSQIETNRRDKRRKKGKKEI